MQLVGLNILSIVLPLIPFKSPSYALPVKTPPTSDRNGFTLFSSKTWIFPVQRSTCIQSQDVRLDRTWKDWKRCVVVVTNNVRTDSDRSSTDRRVVHSPFHSFLFRSKLSRHFPVAVTEPHLYQDEQSPIVIRVKVDGCERVGKEGAERERRLVDDDCMCSSGGVVKL
jgi:hypothetical protein